MRILKSLESENMPNWGIKLILASIWDFIFEIFFQKWGIRYPQFSSGGNLIYFPTDFQKSPTWGDNCGLKYHIIIFHSRNFVDNFIREYVLGTLAIFILTFSKCISSNNISDTFGAKGQYLLMFYVSMFCK